MYGAIFDIDGTLLDSMSLWSVITGKMLAERGFESDETLIKKLQDMTLPTACEYMKNYYNISESTEEIMNDAKRIASEEYYYNIPMKDGAKEYLIKLKNSGVRLAVATSGFPELAEAALKRCGVWELFDAKAYSFETGKDKSNPDIYLLAAERMGVEPEKCTVFEDILPAIYGAKKAGMKTVAVYDPTGEHISGELKREADRYIMSWSEMMK